MKVRNLKWKASFAALLISTAVFIAYAVVASAEQEKPIVVPGLYVGVRPVELDSPPEEYIVLNYSHKSDINEIDLVHVLEYYDDYAEWYKQEYLEGKISEEAYNLSLRFGESGRLTKKVAELFNATSEWEIHCLGHYILWEPQNRWFEITGGCCIDVDSPEYPFGGDDPIHIGDIIPWGGFTLGVGWVGWATLFTRARRPD
ncbi:hypothetical protein DRO69_12235 [Candidatus Bathyarchaeota archaeon]|nr:MAG: hypothetical protein DRO69_12235 [Candidatus Bathyarchaeota archaeon]